MDHGHTCRYIPWFKTMYRQAIEINRSNLSECTPSSTTLDLDSLHRFPVGKRKFQRTRTSFVTGQIVVLERGRYLIHFSNLNSNCCNLLYMRNLQEQVKKHSVIKNCSDLSLFQ